MTNIKKIFAIISAAFVLATASVPAFADDIAPTEETTIEATSETSVETTIEETTIEETTDKNAETTMKKDDAVIIREDVTLITETETTEESIDISREEISVETSTDADISIEYAPVDEEIPNTGSAKNVAGIIGSTCVLALSALAITLKSKKKSA